MEDNNATVVAPVAEDKEKSQDEPKTEDNEVKEDKDKEADTKNDDDGDDLDDLFGSSESEKENKGEEDDEEETSRKSKKDKKRKKDKKEKRRKKEKKDKKEKKRKHKKREAEDQDQDEVERREDEDEPSAKKKRNDEEERMDFEEEKEEKEYGPPEVIEYYPLPTPPKQGKLHYVRLPNIIGIEAHPFDEKTYKEVNVTDNKYDEEGNLVGNKKANINPETVIRWRYVKDENNNLIRESNARFVRWSDNSLSLFIGDEVYDVATQDISQDNNYLFVRQKQFIKCHGLLESKFIFRPSSLGSKTHQKLTNSIVQRHKKERKIKIVLTENDPEAIKQKREKMEEERLKALEASRKSSLEAAKGSAGLTTEMLEDGYSSGEVDDDYEDYDDAPENEPDNAKSGKRRDSTSSNNGSRRRSREEEEEAERRILKAREGPKVQKSKKSDEEEENPSDDVVPSNPLEDDEEEEELPMIKKKARKRVVDDEE